MGAIWILVLVLVVFVFVIVRRRDPYHIVVARYNEDLSWLPNGDPKVKVYDKGSGGNLPNIGRESHTYLTYIVQNYENLPDVVIFTQGSMYDHGYKSYEQFLKLSDDKSHSNNLTHYPYGQFFYDYNTSEWNSDHLYAWKEQNDPIDNLGFRKWFKTYVDVENVHDFKEGIDFWMGAIFSIRRECILSRPKEYYKRLLEYIPKTKNPEVGHFLERSWYYIFNCHL